MIKGFGDGRKRDSASYKSGTPRAGTSSKPARSALRHLPAAGPAKGEFTPLMRSATKNNFLRNGSTTRGMDDPKTPGYLREGGRGAAHTPGLPTIDMSDMYEDDATTDQATPIPQVASSSAQSTPLPGLLGRNGSGILGDGQNMTLKEQERVCTFVDLWYRKILTVTDHRPTRQRQLESEAENSLLGGATRESWPGIQQCSTQREHRAQSLAINDATRYLSIQKESPTSGTRLGGLSAAARGNARQGSTKTDRRGSTT